MTRNSVRLLMDRIEKGTGIETYAHKFRHTCARWSLRSGMSLYALQDLMGHEDLAILKHYARLEENDLARQHHDFGAADRFL